jgi:hypothetical protein
MPLKNLTNVAILTGQTGPGATVTALRLEGVSNIQFDFANSGIFVTYGNQNKIFKLAWTGVTGTTFSISGGVATITVT